MQIKERAKKLVRYLISFKTRLRKIYLTFLGYKFGLNYRFTKLISSPYFKLKAQTSVALWTLLFCLFWFLFRNRLIFNLSPSDALAFFLGLGAMLAGIIALVFTFSQFLLSNASQKFPSNFYEMSARDGFHNGVFFLTSLFVMYFVLASVLYGKLGWGLSDFSIVISIYLVGLVFIFLYLVYEKTIDRTDPQKMLMQVIKKKTLKSVSRLSKNVNKIVDLLKKADSNNTDQKTIKATAYNSPLIQQDLAEIQKNINYLFDYHERLTENSEHASASEVLDLIVTLINAYLEQRKDSSLTIPVGLMFVGQSDSHSFLASSLERLLSISEMYMVKNDKAGILKVVNILVYLCQTATEVKSAEDRIGNNPIFEQFRGYLELMTSSAIRIKNEEAMFQLTMAYQKVSYMAAKHSYRHEFGHVYTALNKIFLASMGEDIELRDVLIGQVIESYSTVLKQLIVEEYWMVQYEIDPLFDHIVETLYYTSLLVKNGGLRSAYFTQTSLTGPFEMARGLMFTLYQQVEEEKVKKKKQKLQSRFLLLVEATRRALRSLAEKMKDPNHLLVVSLAQVIQDITILLIDLLDNNKWSEHKQEIENKIGWYLHQPEWFTVDVKEFKVDQSFTKLVNAVTQIGIKAVDKKKFDIAEEALDLIIKFANEALERTKTEGHGFDEPRIMEKAFYIAVLLHKNEKTEFLSSFKKQVQQFNKSYQDKWFKDLPKGVELSSPQKDQLFKEVLKLLSNRERYYYRDQMLENEFPEQRFMQMVKPEDIKKLIELVWDIEIKD